MRWLYGITDLMNMSLSKLPESAIGKKAFLSEQYKAIEEINRMEQARNLFKIIRDTKGIFHAMTGTIKD